MSSNLEKIKAIKVKVSPIDGMRMIYVPSGEFIMGTNEDDIRAGKEKPQRTIYMDAFWIDQTPVTNAMFVKFLNKMGKRKVDWEDSLIFNDYLRKVDGVWQVKKSYEDHPVVHVTWYGAQAYSLFVGRKLPTHAQWEKAARGTDGRLFPWGNESPNENLINCSREWGNANVVGSYPSGASPYGAVDMTGLVKHWVLDHIEDEKHFRTLPSKNPIASLKTKDVGLRGDIFTLSTNVWTVRADVTNGGSKIINNGRVGFRCALQS